MIVLSRRGIVYMYVWLVYRLLIQFSSHNTLSVIVTVVVSECANNRFHTFFNSFNVTIFMPLRALNYLILTGLKKQQRMNFIPLDGVKDRTDPCISGQQLSEPRVYSRKQDDGLKARSSFAPSTKAHSHRTHNDMAVSRLFSRDKSHLQNEARIIR